MHVEIVLGSVGEGGAVEDVVGVGVVLVGIVRGVDELAAIAEEVTKADEEVELVGPWTQM